MKQLTLDDWIPGGKYYESHQPFSPTKILFCNQYNILCFSDGFVILSNDKIHQNSTQSTSFNQLCQPYYHSYSELSSKANCEIKHPTFYFCEAEGGFILLHLYEDIHFLIVKLNIEHNEIEDVTIANAPEVPLYVQSNENGIVAFSTQRNNLYILDQKRRFNILYHCTTNYKINKTPSRDEFGIEHLIHWSPDNQKIAFYLTEDEKVPEYPYIHLTDIDAPNNKRFLTHTTKYPFAGQESESTRIGILDIETKKIVFIDCKDDPTEIPGTQRSINHQNSYMPCLSWAIDSKHIYVCELERSQKYFQAKKYSADSGTFESFLFDEEDDCYVEPEHSFLSISKSKFIFLSQRTGYNHLYLYDEELKQTETLTQGEWNVTQCIGYSNNKIIYLSTENSLLNQDAYWIDIDSKKTSFLTEKKGHHTLYLNKTNNKWIDCFDAHDNPGEIIFNGESVYSIENPLNGYDLPKQTIGSFPYTLHSQGKMIDHAIYYRVTFPMNYQKGKKYPVIFYVYGGPHVQLISNHWGSGTKGFEEMMSAEGYYVLCADPITSMNRGHKEESVIYPYLNKTQIEDYDASLDYFFKHFEDADRNRIAVYGWSFGGYMTLSMLLMSKYRDHFKIGVAGGAVIDWRYYEVMYSERYMGYENFLDKESKVAKENDIKEKIDLLQTHLYLIHCDNDPVVLPLHPLSLINKINKTGEILDLIDFYLFPGHEHNVKGPQRIALMNKIKSMISNYLNK